MAFIDTLRDIIDILLVSFIIYHFYKIFGRGKVLPISLGLLFLGGIYILAEVLHLETTAWIFSVFSGYILIALIVILQPELRTLFYEIGGSRFFRFFRMEEGSFPVEEIYQAFLSIAPKKWGALVVLPGKVNVLPYIEGGVELNALVSKELLVAIFYGKNPLHDGACLIQGNRIVKAGCYLPLSSSRKLRKTHGARHRAAVGITEVSDALVLIASEETGELGVSYQGDLIEGLSGDLLKSILVSFSTGQLPEKWKEFYRKRPKRYEKVAL